MSKIAVIIVSHNSEDVIDFCLDALASQTVLPACICIVDSGSSDTRYLENAKQRDNVTVLLQKENIGFSRANNIGFAHVWELADYVLFLNPDTLIAESFLEESVRILEKYPSLGIITGRMLGYNFQMGTPTGRLDSTGIFRKWYGRWYDRGQGEENKKQFMKAENIPAACGALMFCRVAALTQVALPENKVFDPEFFLYKEDIELSLRMRKSGWNIRYIPDLLSFHGRGWESDRGKMSRELRKMAARNEILLYRKHPSPYMLWALVKYFLVISFNV